MESTEWREPESSEYAAGWEAYLARLCTHLDGGFLSEDEAIEQTTSKLSLYQRIFADQSSIHPFKPRLTNEGETDARRFYEHLGYSGVDSDTGEPALYYS